MAPVQLFFVYQDDCIFQPYELVLDVEPTCQAEMKAVVWRFVLFLDQFVREYKLEAGRWRTEGMCIIGDFGVAWLSVLPVALKLL